MLTAKSIGTTEQIVPPFPDFEPPSPKNLSRPLRVSLALSNRNARLTDHLTRLTHSARDKGLYP